jgi:predicted TIM-barrel fold metal-dependent hydrolase
MADSLGHELIDSHTHVFPSVADADAWRRFVPKAVKIPRAEGDADDALAVMDRYGIQKMVLLPVLPARLLYRGRRMHARRANKPARAEDVKTQLADEWSRYNAWAIELAARNPRRFASMVAVDPVLFGDDWTRREFDRGFSRGAVGIKICSTWIGQRPSDERMHLVWEEASARGVPVIAQSGLARFGRDPVAHPDHFAPVLCAYPKVKLILAHFGLKVEESAVTIALRHENVFVDTSAFLVKRVGTADGYSLPEAADLIRRIGVERVLFGTNYAVADPGMYVHNLHALPLSDDERRQVASGNYRRVFGDTT